ncbi:hypothetical protein MferCBS31731_004748 [Microsporum ferrugineum]
MEGQTHQGNSQGTYFTQQHQQPFTAQSLLSNQSTSASSQTNSSQDIRLYPANAQLEAEMRTQMQAQPATDQQLQQGQAQSQGICGKAATAQFLQNVNLVAEAARRAQIGILMRDLEEISFD